MKGQNKVQVLLSLTEAGVQPASLAAEALFSGQDPGIAEVSISTPTVSFYSILLFEAIISDWYIGGVCYTTGCFLCLQS